MPVLDGRVVGDEEEDEMRIPRIRNLVGLAGRMEHDIAGAESMRVVVRPNAGAAVEDEEELPLRGVGMKRGA